MKKVLLLSASSLFLRRSTRLMMNQGVQLFTSASGSEALTLHEEIGFDLILCDLELGDMDGCRFCSEVQLGHGSLVPVILICNDNIDFITKAKQSDASAILLRPINQIHLLNTIGSFLDMQLVKNERIVFNAKVLCKTKQLEFLCDSHDINTTRIILETEHQLELGSRVTCKFNLPDICQMQPDGEVMQGFSLHNGKTLYGVKFINLTLSNLRAIEAYVAKNTLLEAKGKPYRPIEKSKHF
jgi:CheY-like chemotaxis protein